MTTRTNGSRRVIVSGAACALALGAVVGAPHAAGGATTGTLNPANVSAAGAMVVSRLTWTGPTSSKVLDCIPMSLSALRISDGQPVAVSGIKLTSSAGGALYTDAACTAATSTVSFSGAKPLYLKASLNASNVSVQATGDGVRVLAGSRAVSVTRPQAGNLVLTAVTFDADPKHLTRIEGEACSINVTTNIRTTNRGLQDIPYGSIATVLCAAPEAGCGGIASSWNASAGAVAAGQTRDGDQPMIFRIACNLPVVAGALVGQFVMNGGDGCVPPGACSGSALSPDVSTVCAAAMAPGGPLYGTSCFKAK